MVQKLCLLRELKDTQPSVNLTLLADGNTPDVHPSVIQAVERSSHRCWIACAISMQTSEPCADALVPGNPPWKTLTPCLSRQSVCLLSRSRESARTA